MKTEKSKPAAAPRPPAKVFDVTRPGKTPAAPTSRPVIMGHKVSAQKAQITVSGVGDDRQLLSHKRKIELLSAGASEAEKPAVSAEKPIEKKVMPPEPAAPSHATKAETEALASTALAATTQAPEPKPEPKSEEPVPAPTPQEPVAAPKPKPTPAPSPPAEEPAPTATPQPAQPAAPEPLLAQAMLSDDSHAAEADDFKPQDLIVVSQHHTDRSSAWEVVLIILLVIALAAIALNILLDTGILTLPGLPHTNFFQQ